MTQHCERCGAAIQELTFLRTGGLCRPCYRGRLRSELGRTPFGAAYDRWFHRPELQNWKYFDCWIRFELAIAGPLSSARERGEMEFIFRKPVIPGVTNLDQFMTWARTRLDEFQQCVQQVTPSTDGEKSYLAVLLTWASELEVMIGFLPALLLPFRGQSAH